MNNVIKFICVLIVAAQLGWACYAYVADRKISELHAASLGKVCRNVVMCPPQCLPPGNCANRFNFETNQWECNCSFGGTPGVTGVGQVGSCVTGFGACSTVSSPCGMPAYPQAVIIGANCVAFCHPQLGPPPPGC